MKKIPVLGLLFTLIFLAHCTDVKEASKNTATVQSTPEPSDLTGEELAKIHCASCHKYPAPDLLDKKTWGEFVLLRMSSLMGIYHDDQANYIKKMPAKWIEPGLGGKRVLAANIYPEQPLIAYEDWEKIRDFYFKNAPAKLPAAPTKNIKIGLPNFKVEPFNKTKEIPPLVQAITYDDQEKKVYVGVYNDGIYQLGADGKLEDKTYHQAFFVDFAVQNQQFLGLNMATRYATDNPQGSLQMATDFKTFKNPEERQQISGLMRPVSFTTGDLDGDEQDDFLVSEYGNMLGQLAWYESKGEGSGFEKNVLFSDDGSIKTEILDLNNDGRNDILALQGNGDEGIDQYLNEGNGKFQRQRLLRFLPTNGSTDFQAVDFDKDGQKDLLYANGDNGDYTPILKPYHGIHLFLNKNGEYQEAFFLPMNGVYQAEAVDFDQDGDLDIAAVSFHPDFQNGAKESFVLFENDGQNNFQAHTISQHRDSRWMRFTTGDVDGDGDVDILLSAMNIKTPEIPATVAQRWKEKETAILLLRNEVR